MEGSAAPNVQNIPWASVAKRLSELFVLPRAFGVGRKRKWSRVHEMLDASKLERFLKEGTPIAVAMKAPSNDEVYTNVYHFLIFDIDSTNIDKSSALSNKISAALTSDGYSHLNSFSGVKGFHSFVFLKEPITAKSAIAWQGAFLEKLGAKRNKTDQYILDGCKIDTQITEAVGDGLIIKLPFSRHVANFSRYEIPVNTAKPQIKDLEFDCEVAIACMEILNKVEKVVLHGIGTVSAPEVIRAPKKRSKSNGHSDWVVPAVASEGSQEAIIRKIESTPCLKAAYREAKTKDGGFWPRVVLCTTFAKCGFSRTDVAVFIRDNINDDEDNASGKMQYYVDYCFERRNWSSCDIFKNPESHTPVCPYSCGRGSPKAEQKYFIDEADAKVKCRVCKYVCLQQHFIDDKGVMIIYYACHKCGWKEENGRVRADWIPNDIGDVIRIADDRQKMSYSKTVAFHNRGIHAPAWRIIEEIGCNDECKEGGHDHFYKNQFYTKTEIGIAELKYKYTYEQSD